MKASDLRIGNWVLDCEADADESIYWKVEEIQRLSENKALNQTVGVTYRRGSCWSCDVEPIPLTEEWLLKFGFKQDVDSSFVLNNTGVFLDKRFKENIYLRTKEGGRFGSEVWNKIDNLKIKHVHQLQNLYHALTQKELIYEETV